MDLIWVVPRDGLGGVGKKEVLFLSVIQTFDIQPVTIHYVGPLPEINSHLLYDTCLPCFKTQRLLLQTLRRPGFTMLLAIRKLKLESGCGDEI